MSLVCIYNVESSQKERKKEKPLNEKVCPNLWMLYLTIYELNQISSSLYRYAQLHYKTTLV